VRIEIEHLIEVVGPWADAHGFSLRAAEDRVSIEIEAGGRTLAIVVSALDAFGNVALDVDSADEHHAYTGPLPDLIRMLEEAREQIERPAPQPSRPYAVN
jgi:hypothetical protein